MPMASSVFSAWGMMMSDCASTTLLPGWPTSNWVRLRGSRRCLSTPKLTRASYSRARALPPTSSPSYDMEIWKFRYQNQEHTIEVRLEPGAITEDRLSNIGAAFHETYESEHTYHLKLPVEFVGIHLVAVAAIGKLTLTKREPTGATD